MNRKVFNRIAAALLLALPLGLALAQDDDGADTTAPTSPVFGPFNQLDDPLQAEMRQSTDLAWVRVINLSPGAQAHDFSLVSADPEVPAPVHDAHTAVALGEVGTYATFPAGSYDLRLLGGDESNVENFNLAAGRFYTLVLLGLELPPDAEAEGGNSGFFGWVRGLFGGEDGSDTYRSRALLLEDNLYQSDMGSSALIRVVNAAPGLGSTSVAVQGESGRLTGEAAYGTATGNNYVNTSGLTGPLEVRIDSSRVITIPLDELDLTAGTLNNVFIYGTPLEDAPVRALVVTTPTFSDF